MELHDTGLATGTLDVTFGTQAPLSTEEPDGFHGSFSATYCELPTGTDVVGCE